MSLLGMFAHPNKKALDNQVQTINEFYSEVEEMAQYFYSHAKIPDKQLQWIKNVLFTSCPACIKNHAKFLYGHWKTLGYIRRCKPKSLCQFPTYCPKCLAIWRYEQAKTIMEMHKRIPDLRLILRRETFLMPRGVYLPIEGNGVRLMIGDRINPVHQLPTGTKWHPSNITRIVEDGMLKEYRDSEDYSSDQYEDVIEKVWSLIGGPDTFVKPHFIEKYENSEEEDKARIHSGMLNASNVLKEHARKGISDWKRNPLILELGVHATRISKQFKDAPGYIHRFTIVPSRFSHSVVMLRLDSLILDVRRDYDKYRKDENMFWISDSHFNKLPWHNDPRSYWSLASKSTNTCRCIPDDFNKLLELIEDRFPFTGHLYTKFLPEEFLFYMNCFSNYKMIRTGGVFKGIA